MLYAVIFEDAPDAPADLRARHMSAHLAFLSENADAVRAAGPLLAENAAPSGGLWLVEAAARETVLNLVHADPFWPTGLRKSVQILEWRQVFRDGAVVAPSSPSLPRT